MIIGDVAWLVLGIAVIAIAKIAIAAICDSGETRRAEMREQTREKVETAQVKAKTEIKVAEIQAEKAKALPAPEKSSWF